MNNSSPFAKRTLSNDTIISHLRIIDIFSLKEETVFSANYHFEAPNWSPDGNKLVFNSRGQIYALSIGEIEPRLISTGFANKCNNDHVLSPDGSKIAISHHTKEDGLSRIYILPVEGGEPELITPQGPSYLHGWSPDGKVLAYCAERNGTYNIYSTNIFDRNETQLTFTQALDDGPEYSHDGEYIYFNSARTGRMKIWRMKTDGSNQTQITFDGANDWFPHESPDGKWIVFLSYDENIEGHPANKIVKLRIMEPNGSGPRTILNSVFGGQGTINVPSWSPDSRKFAFVSYELLGQKYK